MCNILAYLRSSHALRVFSSPKGTASVPKEKAPARKGQRLELSGNAVILYKKKEEGQTISLYI